MNYRIKITLGLFLLGLLLQLNATAQQQMENSMSQYFQSRMLWNPGFTGADGSKIYALQNRSWVGFDGAPVMTSLSGEFLFGKNSAAALQVLSDATGILYRTFGVVNYAYRLKLSTEEQLRIGISLSFASDRLNTNYIAETGADPLILNSINPNAQFDGNIGFVYKNKKITTGISFFRLRENLSPKEGTGANLAVTQLSFGYDMNLSSDKKLLLNPLAMLRLYRGTGAVADIGAQLFYNKQVNTMLVYQTTGNIRAGAGIQLKNIADVNFFYNTNIKVANAASQQYEVGLAFHLKSRNQD